MRLNLHCWVGVAREGWEKAMRARAIAALSCATSAAPRRRKRSQSRRGSLAIALLLLCQVASESGSCLCDWVRMQKYQFLCALLVRFGQLELRCAAAPAQGCVFAQWLCPATPFRQHGERTRARTRGARARPKCLESRAECERAPTPRSPEHDECKPHLQSARGPQGHLGERDSVVTACSVSLDGPGGFDCGPV